MILTSVRKYLENNEFQIMQTNISNVKLYFTIVSEIVYTVMLLDVDYDNKITKEQYNHIKNQITWNFIGKGYQHIELLGILFCNNFDYFKEFCDEDDLTWIIDTKMERLIIYENQRTDFLGLKEIIEGIIESSQTTSSHGGARKYSNLSFCNTLIVLINIIVFLFTNKGTRSIGSDYLLKHGALYGPLVMDGEFYRLVTYMFLHGGLDHIVNNMMILLFIGDNLERCIGKIKYLFIYFLSGILAGVVSIGYNRVRDFPVVCVGASGAIFGVVGALAYIIIVNKGRLEGIGKGQMFLFIVFSLYGGFTSKGVDNAAHIGGLVSGILIAAILYKRKVNVVEFV